MRRKQKIDPDFAVKPGEQILSDTGQHICMAEGCFDVGPIPPRKQTRAAQLYLVLS